MPRSRTPRTPLGEPLLARGPPESSRSPQLVLLVGVLGLAGCPQQAPKRVRRPRAPPRVCEDVPQTVQARVVTSARAPEALPPRMSQDAHRAAQGAADGVFALCCGRHASRDLGRTAGGQLQRILGAAAPPTWGAIDTRCDACACTCGMFTRAPSQEKRHSGSSRRSRT